MKKITTLALLLVAFVLKAQIYPLNTYTDVPNNSYIKDINNELLPYVGTWKGTWDNKVIYIYFKRFKKQISLGDNIYFEDVLVGKFKVLNANETVILFDNTYLPDNDAKIIGLRFFTVPTTSYNLLYIDPDICNMSGNIYISTVNGVNTQLNWQYSSDTGFLSAHCSYVTNNLPIPQPLPDIIVLTKQ